MPRRFAYKAPPAAIPAPVDRLARVGRIVVEGRCPGGVVAPVALDPAKYTTPVLARELAQAWAERFAGDAQPSLATMYRHKSAVVDLLEYCSRVGAPVELSCRGLTATLLDDWQDDVAGRQPGQSHVAGQNAGIVFALLRRVSAVR